MRLNPQHAKPLLPFALQLPCIMLALLGSVGAQPRTLTLRECHELVWRNSPLAGQDSLVMALASGQRREVTLAYLPRVALVGQVAYQSDGPHLDLPPLPLALRMPSRDQQALYVQVQQPLWDGGAAHSRRRILRAQADKHLWEARLAMERIHEQVERLYYAVLLHDRQMAAQEVVIGSILRNAQRVDTLIAHGVASHIDARYIEVERLRIQQESDQLRHRREGMVAALGMLLGATIEPNTQFLMPTHADRNALDSAWPIDRIELKVYDAEQQEVVANLDGLAMTLTPKLFLYCQVGYAKPGPNIFNHQFGPYCHVGVRLHWDLDPLYSHHSHKRALRVQRAINRKAERAFRQGVKAQAEQLRHTLCGVEASLQGDSIALAHCEAIRLALELRFQQGDATAHDLLNGISQWQMALQRQALHQVQRAQIMGELEGALKGWRHE